MNFNKWSVAGWYMNEQEKRKERMKAQDVSILNRQLQELLHEVQHKIDDWKLYEQIANTLEQDYRVSSSSLWNLTWANNYESEQVALAQGLLLAHILKRESHEEVTRWKHRLDGLMRRLGNVDWGIYLQYGRLRGR